MSFKELFNFENLFETLQSSTGDKQTSDIREEVEALTLSIEEI